MKKNLSLAIDEKLKMLLEKESEIEQRSINKQVAYILKKFFQEKNNELSGKK